MKTGDRIICIKSFSNINKGQVYIIQRVLQCRCKAIALDVGVCHDSLGTYCGKCLKEYPGIHFFSKRFFRSPEYASAHSELTNIVEEKLDIKELEKA